MKKALVVFLALALVAGVFADEPVAESSVSGFDGSASVTWGVDLDAGTTGFKNDASANFKVKLAAGGDKTSAGDGVWGEIKIKTDGLAIENGAIANGGASVEFAKLHLGPVYVGITAGDTEVGGYNAPRALNQEQKAKVDAKGEKKEKGIVIGYSAGDIFSIDVDF
ncbi:MAG TPA: autotransporter, partial [Treponemataceae bacterium]|nr:autotransporter [Treponemataceae bacterium]